MSPDGVLDRRGRDVRREILIGVQVYSAVSATAGVIDAAADRAAVGAIDDEIEVVIRLPGEEDLKHSALAAAIISSLDRLLRSGVRDWLSRAEWFVGERHLGSVDEPLQALAAFSFGDRGRSVDRDRTIRTRPPSSRPQAYKNCPPPIVSSIANVAHRATAVRPFIFPSRKMRGQPAIAAINVRCLSHACSPLVAFTPHAIVPLAPYFPVARIGQPFTWGPIHE